MTLLSLWKKQWPLSDHFISSAAKAVNEAPAEAHEGETNEQVTKYVPPVGEEVKKWVPNFAFIADGCDPLKRPKNYESHGVNLGFSYC